MKNFAVVFTLFAVAFTALLTPVPSRIGSIVRAQSFSAPDRVDFVATAGQTTFPTSNVSPGPNVQVFRNGLLQRQGATADYTQQFIQNGTRIRVTFNVAPDEGDYVTLLYWR